MMAVVFLMLSLFLVLSILSTCDSFSLLPVVGHNNRGVVTPPAVGHVSRRRTTSLSMMMMDLAPPLPPTTPTETMLVTSTTTPTTTTQPLITVSSFLSTTTTTTAAPSALQSGIQAYYQNYYESSSVTVALQERKIPTPEEIAQKKLTFNLIFWGGGFVAPFAATVFYFGFKFWEK